MEIEVLENSADKLKLRVHDNTTILNLVNENVWSQTGVDFSAVTMEHPYLSYPVITIKSKKAKKALTDAIDQITTDTKDLRKKFQAKMK